MEDINLYFNGDFYVIIIVNNVFFVFIDNYLY